MTGVIVTSISCSGTCFTFSIPRQPKLSVAESALARGGCEAARRLAEIRFLQILRRGDRVSGCS